MICLSADREWFVIWIKVKILKFVFFRRFVRDRWRIFLQLPIFKTFIWESKNLIFDCRIEHNFMECFTFVNNLCDLFSSLFADDMNGIEMNLRISFIINILKLCNGISSWIFFLMSFYRIHFDHLIGASPENVNSWIVINWHDDSDLNFLFSAFLIGGEFQFWSLECFLDFASFAYFPAMQ